MRVNVLPLKLIRSLDPGPMEHARASAMMRAEKSIEPEVNSLWFPLNELIAIALS